ncbi:MAG TPA: TPM domain-containing protein [Bdellovibrionota bacterium]|nr:TPM domain-containing protein [Bdellovibrionota bacterium]
MIRALAVALALGWSMGASALDVPAHTGLVVDQAGILDEPLERNLEASLRQFQAEKGPQLQVLTVRSLGGQPIEDYSIRVADAWKLGDRARDDGVLLLIALEDRAARIEVGQGLEGTLPDITAGRIVSQVLVPRFREGRYDDGTVAALQAIAGQLGGTLTAPAGASYASPRETRGFGIGLFPILLLFFLIVPRMLGGRRRRYGGGGRGLMTGMLLGHLLGSGRRRGGLGGGWGGGGGGGIFGGGGGGGFSGGGASGRW